VSSNVCETFLCAEKPTLLSTIMFSHAVTKAFSCQPFTTESKVRPCGICGGQSGTGTGFSHSSSISPVSIIPPWHHAHISSGGWTIDLLVAAIQRHSLTPSTWITWTITFKKMKQLLSVLCFVFLSSCFTYWHHVCLQWCLTHQFSVGLSATFKIWLTAEISFLHFWLMQEPQKQNTLTKPKLI
jgi:hypothetical protein